MPRIDPIALLKCLNVLLNEQGGIKGTPEVKRLVALMRKFSNKLVSKCCYILILKETNDELLSEFMAEGGWCLIFQWLGDAINVNNYPFIREVMSLLIKCPISLERLKENNCPKVIKGLSKDSEDPGVRELAGVIVEQWLQFIKSGRAGVDPEPTPIPAVVIPAPASPPAPPVEDTERIPKFKITVRDGKSVLAKVPVNPDSDEDMDVVEKSRDSVTKKSSDKLVAKKQGETVKKRDSEGERVSAKKKESDGESRKKSSDVERKRSDVERGESRKRDSDGKRRDSDGREKKSESSAKHSSSSKNREKSSHSKSDSHNLHRNDDIRRKEKSSSSYQSKSKDKEKEKEKSSSRDIHKKEEKSDSDSKSQFDKDKDTLSKINRTPNISSLGKIPKKSSTGASSSVASSSSVLSTNPVVRPPESPTLPTARKGSYSDERKRTAELKPSERPKTVKTLPTKFRSTGLEGEVKPPPSRADIKKKEVAEKRPELPKRSSPTSSSFKEGPPEKKSKVMEILAEKKEKILDKPGGIKLIPPKPKPVLLESDMFSDALTASAKIEPRKKKRRVSATGKDAEVKKEATDDGETSPVDRTSSPPRESSKAATSPPRDIKPNLKFYRDTLEDPEQDAKAEVKAEAKEVKSEAEEPRAKYYPEGVLMTRSRQGAKKCVRWRTETELVAIREFELDETERVNVTRNFGEMKMMDRNKEREAAFLLRRPGTENIMEGAIAWGPLFLVDVPEDKQAPEPGKNSEEINIQFARAKSTLQAIYFSRDMIPDSPAEPDPETQPMTDPRPIPLEDVTGSTDNVIDFSKAGWPEPKPDVEINVNVVTPVAPPISEPTTAPIPEVPTAAVPMPPPYGAYTAPGFQGFVPQGPDGWRPPNEMEDMTPQTMGFPAVPMGPMGPPQMFGPPPFGPPGGMMTPDGFPMGPMYGGPPGFPMGPPADMFPPQGPAGPMGPMGPPPPNWNRGGPGPGGWGGPRGPFMRNICRNFQRNGSCARGDQCRFLHPGINCPPLS